MRFHCRNTSRYSILETRTYGMPLYIRILLYLHVKLIPEVNYRVSSKVMQSQGFKNSSVLKENLLNKNIFSKLFLKSDRLHVMKSEQSIWEIKLYFI